MAATLKIINNAEIVLLGETVTVKQGSTDDGIKTAFEFSVTGEGSHIPAGILATASAATIWDDDTHQPDDFDYFIYWADQDSYIQIIGSGSNAIFKVEAKMCFVIPGFDTILAAADTTKITGGSEPSLTDIDNITIGNYSGETMNFKFLCVD